LKIASLDVRGLGNNAKRKEVFNWLRVKNKSIYMLQEVHCSQETTDIWTCEWGYKALFSADAAATKQGLVFCPTITSIVRSTRFSRIQMDAF